MKSLMVSVLLLCVAVMIQLPGQCASKPSPILLIPGLMGSQLTVKDTKPNSICATGRKFKELWISPLRLVVYNVCAKRELPLVYDAGTGSFHNNSNVKIHVPGFGDTDSVEYLNPGWIDTIPYYHKLVKYFVKRGYERGKTIRAAPYDWRLAADELERLGYFHRLKSLVEDMYESSGQTKVTLVVHSMGGPVSLHFFTAFSGINQTWKDKHIHAYIPIAGAWSGGVATLQTVISGAHDIPDLLLFASGLINNFIVPITRTFESLPWLFPKPSVFGNRVLISTPSRDYTANDYAQLFSDISYANGYRFYQGVQGLNPNYPAPNVPTYCYYGTNVDTPEKFTYKKNFSNLNTIGLEPSIKNGNGDGSVNILSSMVCHRWSSMPSNFTYKEYSNAGHKAILSNNNVLADIASVVGAPKKKKSWFEKLFG